MSCMQSFDKMCKKIVCPTRHYLNQFDMSIYIYLKQSVQRKFRTKNMNYEFLDIPSKNGYTLSGTIFIKDFNKYPTVLYLHGNGGHKLECLQLASNNINLISFDFSGCGKSEGQFLTYGQREVKDISSVIAYVSQRYRQPELKFNLWGRSMGASLALMYASLEPEKVSCMILDSPFRKLTKVIQNVARNSQKSVPNVLLNFALFLIERKVREICGFDVFSCDYLDHLNLLYQVPILFCYSENDSVVKMDDVKQLYQNYQGPKYIYKISSLHHEDRPKDFIEYALSFILDSKQVCLNQSIASNSKLSLRKGISLSTRRQIKKPMC